MPTQEKWITKHEAEERFGLSARQIERYVSDGRLKKRTMPRGPGESRDPVCVLESDLAAIKAGTAPPPTTSLTTSQPRALVPPSQSAVATSHESTSVELTWLTLDQAAECGLPMSWLKRAAETGAVRAIDVSSSPARRVWRFHREGLAEAKAIEGYAVAAR